MQPTIYAAFNTVGEAERAAGALMDHGFKAEDISVIVSEHSKHDDLDYTHPQTVVRGEDALNTVDPMNNQMRDTPVTVDMAVDGDLGPGQELLDAPPVAHETLENPPHSVEYDYDAERAAKAGVTTTTIEDAASAAKKGALFGVGIGTLAAVAALAIPGYGLVVGGGALAVAAAGLAASAGAGAVAGGVVGYLKDQGVPAHDIPHYEKAINGGGAVVAVHAEPASDITRVQEILGKYGAYAMNDYGYAA